MHSSKPYRIPGLELVDHYFKLPLDYAHPEGRKIQVFAHEVRDLDPASVDKPFLLFLSRGLDFGHLYRFKKQG